MIYTETSVGQVQRELDWLEEKQRRMDWDYEQALKRGGVYWMPQHAETYICGVKHIARSRFDAPPRNKHDAA